MADHTPTPTPDDPSLGGAAPAPGPAPAPQPGYQAPPPGYQVPPMAQQPYYGQPAPGAYGTGGGQLLSDADQRTYATLTHVLGIFFGFIPGLIVYLVFKDRGEYIKYQAREALNFQLTMLIGMVVGSILIIAVVGVFIILAVWILSIVLSIMAAVATNRGEPYRYPLSIRMVS